MHNCKHINKTFFIKIAEVKCTIKKTIIKLTPNEAVK